MLRTSNAGRGRKPVQQTTQCIPELKLHMIAGSAKAGENERRRTAAPAETAATGGLQSWNLESIPLMLTARLSGGTLTSGSELHDKSAAMTAQECGVDLHKGSVTAQWAVTSLQL